MSFSLGLFWDGPHNSTVEQSGRIVSRFSRVYLYKTDAAARPTEAAILVDVGIDPGSSYPNDPNATCESVELGPGPERTRPPNLCYQVKVEWSTTAPVPNAQSTDPTTTRTIWTLGSTIQSRYIVKDRNGEMILNSAGQPFDGGVPVDQRFGKATAVRNVDATGYDKDAIVAMSGKLNTDIYLGGDPGTVQVDVEASEKYEGDYHFWEERYTFNHKPDGWQPNPMNAGFFQKTDDAECLTRIINSDLHDGSYCSGDANDPTAPVQEPEPLLTNGKIVPIADRPDLCNFVDVDFFESFDMSTLGL